MNRFVNHKPFSLAFDSDTAEIIWNDALLLLAETGVDIHDEAARSTFASAGARVEGVRSRLDPGMVREAVAKAPTSFSLVARNPAHNVTVGGRDVVASPIYGATHVLDDRGNRRPGTLADLHAFHDLAQAVPYIQNVGSNIVEATDIAPELRHLHVMRSVLTRTDKTFMPVTTSRDLDVSSLGFAAVRARDSLAMTECVFGRDFGSHPRMVGVASCLEALTWSRPALEAIRLFAEAGQAIMLAPFAVVGKTAPAEPSAVLTQITAEILAGAAYAQLVRPGTPVLFGPHFVILGKDGARISAGPDAEFFMLASGQMARRAGLPFRASGCLTGAKTVDAQAAGEGTAMLAAAISGGAHYLFHAAGWLDDGLTISEGKFALDTLMLADAQRRVRTFELPEPGQAIAELSKSGPAFDHTGSAAIAHELGAYYRPSPMADYRSWDAWRAAGGKASETVAREEIRKFESRPMPLDPDRIAALDEFISRRSVEITRSLGK